MIRKRLASVLPAQETPRENTKVRARSQRGETLIETLFGILIAGLSIVLLSMAITSASRLVIKTRDMAETYESSTRALAPGAGTSSSTVEITSSGNFGESYNGTSVDVTYAQGNLPGSITGVTYSQKAS